MTRICWHCDIESDEKGYIIETEEYDWICKDCLHDYRLSYYDIEKAAEWFAKTYKKFGEGSN